MATVVRSVISPSVDFIEQTLKTLPDFEWSRDEGYAEPLGQPTQRLVEKEAIGVVACITPWNVPLQINLAKCIPALAAGCTIVLKAAPIHLGRRACWDESLAAHTDIPAGVFNVITPEDPAIVGDQLINDPRVDMVSFTGSTAIGKHIMSAAAKTVKKVFLEPRRQVC